MGKALQHSIKRLGLERKFKAQQVFQIWDRVVGEQIAAMAQPQEIRFKTLYVQVAEAIWLQHLVSLKALVRDKLNRHLGEELIGDIYFRLGPLRHGEKGRERRSSSTLPASPVPRPCLEEVGMEAHLARIRDEETRAILRGLMIKGWRA